MTSEGYQINKPPHKIAKADGQANPYAVVIGLDSINGLQTARTLNRRGVPVIGVAKDLTRYHCRTRVCERIIAADTESEDLIRCLESLAPTLRGKAVVFPCNDLEVRQVSRHRQRLTDGYHVILPEIDVVEMMSDKTRFYAFAQAEGFPIPRTWMLKSRSEAERAAEEISFPCVLKPAFRSSTWEEHSKFKVYKTFSRDEFLTAYACCQQWSTEFVVQEWIEGPESNLYTCYSYFGENSIPLVTFMTRKLRQWPPGIGEGCLGEECRNDDVLAATVRLFEHVHLRGLGYLEMKRDAHSGKHFIMEPNIGRPTSRSATAEAGGVELVYTMYCDALGWPLPPNREQAYGHAKWIFLRRDLQSAFHYWRRGELSIADWIRSLQGIKVSALFSWRDPGPFIADIQRAIRLIVFGIKRLR